MRRSVLKILPFSKERIRFTQLVFGKNDCTYRTTQLLNERDANRIVQRKYILELVQNAGRRAQHITKTDTLKKGKKSDYRCGWLWACYCGYALKNWQLFLVSIQKLFIYNVC